MKSITGKHSGLTFGVSWAGDVDSSDDYSYQVGWWRDAYCFYVCEGGFKTEAQAEAALVKYVQFYERMTDWVNQSRTQPRTL